MPLRTARSARATSKEPRLSQVLPIIRCSDCGHDVEFRKLSEHICIAAPAMPVLPLLLSKQPSSEKSTPATSPLASPTRTSHLPLAKIPTYASPLSPARSASAISRPALPYLEKYSKKKSLSAPALLSQPILLPSQEQISAISDINNNDSRRGSQQHHTISPIVAATLSYGRDSPLRAPQRDTTGLSILTRPSLDERRTLQTTGGAFPPGDRMETITCSYPVRQKPARAVSHQLPILPRKSAARSSAIASRGLGITMEPATGASRRNTGGAGVGSGLTNARTQFGQDQSRRREWERSNRAAPVVATSGTNVQTTDGKGDGSFSSSGSRLAAASLIASSRRRSQGATVPTPSQPDLADRSMTSDTSFTMADTSNTRLDDLAYPDNVHPIQINERRSSLNYGELRRLSVASRDSNNSFHSSSSSPKSATSPSFKSSSPPLSPTKEEHGEHGEHEEHSEMDTNTKSPAYRPPTPPESTASSASSPTLSKAATDRTSSEVRLKQKTSLDHFDALMQDLMQEINVLPPVPRQRQPRAVRSGVENSGDALEKEKSSSPTPAPIPVPQTKSIRRLEDRRSTPSPTQRTAPRRSEDTTTNNVTNTITKVRTSLLPTLTQIKSAVRRTQDLRKNTASPQPRSSTPERRSEDTPASPPLQPKATRRAPIVIPIVEESSTSRRSVDRQRSTTPPAAVATPVGPAGRTLRPIKEIKIVAPAPTPAPRPALSRLDTSRQALDARKPSSPSTTSPTKIGLAGQETKVVMISPTSSPTTTTRRRSEDVRRSVSPVPPPATRVLHRIDETQTTKTTTNTLASPRLNPTRIVHRTEQIKTIKTLAPTANSAPTPAQAPAPAPAPAQASAPEQTPASPQSQLPVLLLADDMLSPKSSKSEPPSNSSTAINMRRSEDFHRTLQQQREARAPAREIREIRTERVVMERPQEKASYRDDHVLSPIRANNKEKVEAQQPAQNKGKEKAKEPEEPKPEPERVNVRNRDRSSADPNSARSPTRNAAGRGGIERCADCKQDILPSELADSIKMAYSSYHLECLNCAKCRRPLGSVLHAHEYEARVLCERDFAKMIAKELHRPTHRRPVCAGCEAPIQSTDRTVYALEKPWHEHHLCCYHCLKPIKPNVGHLEKNGRVYCLKDFKELFLPRCKACGLTVEKSDAVCAQDGKLKGKWHAKCFRCTTCKRPFPDKKFYVHDSAPYCKRHYHRLNNSMCTRCDEPIEGACAQTMEGWRFHTKCFTCAICTVKLSDTYFSFEGRTYCEEDILFIQRTRKIHAERRMTLYGEVL